VLALIMVRLLVVFIFGHEVAAGPLDGFAPRHYDSFTINFTSMELTKEHFDQVLKGLATKAELKGLATKQDLKKLATKDELKGLATKQDLKGLATKDELAQIRATLVTINETLDTHTVKLDALRETVDSHTITLDGISKNTVNWNTEMASMREALKRHEQAFRILAGKVGLNADELLSGDSR
jgi:septation ring formation regulator EzrA